MTNEELINNILGSPEDLPLRRALTYWLGEFPRFRNFVLSYRGKIRNKVQGIISGNSNEWAEDLEDVRYELETACILLATHDFQIEYEKYGTDQRAPDYTVRSQQFPEFNTEVKRLREAELARKYVAFTDRIDAGVRKLPPGFLVSLYLPTRDLELDMSQNTLALYEMSKDFVAELVRSEGAIIAFIAESMKRYESEGIEGPKFFPMPQLKGNVDFLLMKSSMAMKPPSSLVSFLKPVFYNEKEAYKICDTIFEKLGQMRPGEINLLIIRSTSSTHDKDHVAEAIGLLQGAVESGDEPLFQKKKFAGAADFEAQMKNLSGILFRSSSFISREGFLEEPERTVLWCNESANQKITEALREHLRTLTVPYPRR